MAKPKPKTDYSEFVVESLLPLVVPIESINLDPQNARVHPEENLEAISNSLQLYKQRKPIVVRKDTMTVEAGNGLLAAARGLGWPVVAAVFVDDDDDHAKAYGIMDNQSALLAEWDLPTLKDLLKGLESNDFDLDATGFGPDEIGTLMSDIDLDASDGQGRKVIDEMELQPYEHYDYLLVLANDVRDWEALCDVFGIKRVVSQRIKRATKIGIGRCISAKRVLEKLHGAL